MCIYFLLSQTNTKLYYPHGSFSHCNSGRVYREKWGGNCIALYSVSPKLPRTIRVACFGRRRTDFHVFRELSSSFFCCRFLSCQTARLFPRCGFLMWRIGAGARDLQDIDKPMFDIRYISKCKCT